MVLEDKDIFKYFECKEEGMSEERKMKILVPTAVGGTSLLTVMLTVFLIDNYSAEIISLFKQLLFICCFFVASYIVGLIILKIFSKLKGKEVLNFQSKKFIEEEEEELEWLFIGKEERMKLLELQKKKK